MRIPLNAGFGGFVWRGVGKEVFAGQKGVLSGGDISRKTAPAGFPCGGGYRP